MEMRTSLALSLSLSQQSKITAQFQHLCSNQFGWQSGKSCPLSPVLGPSFTTYQHCSELSLATVFSLYFL